MLERAADEVLPATQVEFTDVDVIDTLREQRVTRLQENGEETDGMLPAELLRRFEVRVVPRSEYKPLPLRGIKAEHVGKLVMVKGIVTRVTDVKPLVKVVTYTCDACGHEVYQTVDAQQFTPLQVCPSDVCKRGQSHGQLYPQTRGSKFAKYQDLRLQELPGEVPVGSIPRSMTVSLRGELTRNAIPGDIVTLTGVFLVRRKTGFRAMRAGLTADTYLEIMDLKSHKKSYSDVQLSEEDEEAVIEASQDADIYKKLSQSIAPEIFGHEDIKKALLLLLVGAPTRTLSDLKIRGDINILLMGDPGVAKSQLLKHIAGVAPRGIYTTGKGSSGVGLTAAVIRDQVTGEMSLEGGALVLADMGICCIDEFDKMEESDRTAIHEVMEQQSVSIAKAGITTTLNARTSVLAAANPIYGRYNIRRTPEENIGLPAALLSRFDLTYILRDVPDENTDKLLAHHITEVHRFNRAPKLEFEPYSSAFLRAYVAHARGFEPTVPPHLTDFITSSYVHMRNENKADDPNRQRFCTARSLLSILRLSQAVARLRFSESVEEPDVVEAIRLLFMTKAQLNEEHQHKPLSTDSQTEIFNILKAEAAKKSGRSIKFSAALSRVNTRGFDRAQLLETLELYERLNLLQFSNDRITIV